MEINNEIRDKWKVGPNSGRGTEEWASSSATFIHSSILLHLPATSFFLVIFFHLILPFILILFPHHHSSFFILLHIIHPSSSSHIDIILLHMIFPHPSSVVITFCALRQCWSWTGSVPAAPCPPERRLCTRPCPKKCKFFQ